VPSIGFCLSEQRREKRCLKQQEQYRELRKIIEDRRNIKKLAGAGVYPIDTPPPASDNFQMLCLPVEEATMA
jgi:glycine cleavage system pyridoxal-binding protein P